MKGTLMIRSLPIALSISIAWLGLCLDFTTGNQPAEDQAAVVVLKPARLFDGATARLQEGWAVVATGSYAPRGFAPEVRVPQGAEEADGIDALLRIIRDQIARGADWIKFYADFFWGPGKGARPTFTLNEMKRIVETARAAGCP